MEDAGAGTDIGTLIIVDNFVEADDLIDAFERRLMGPVLHLRTVDTARAMLAEAGQRPQLVVIGVAPDAATTAALIAEQCRAGGRVLVLNGPPPATPTPGVVHLSRPWTESDLTGAIRQLTGEDRPGRDGGWHLG